MHIHENIDNFPCDHNHIKLGACVLAHEHDGPHQWRGFKEDDRIGGDIDNYLRMALNIACIASGDDLDRARDYVAERLRRVGPWPGAPTQAFPFTTNPGEQVI